MTERPPSTMADIIAAWSRFDHALPEAAIRSALARREEATPALLERLARVAARPALLNDRGEYWSSLFSLYVLAAFRESRTLAPIKTALDVAGRDFTALWGEEAAADASRLFASWSFADPNLLKPFVENQIYGDALRSAALEAFVILGRSRAVDAGGMRDYLRLLADGALRRDPGGADSWLWHVWGLCCVEFAAEDLYPLVEEAHNEGWLDDAFMPWEDWARLLADGGGAAKESLYFGEPIDDPIRELRGWHCFSEAARREAQTEARRDGEYNLFRHRNTIANPVPAPKPNRPCPCGSGKKYKKCCGR